ncbi:MAG: hypothetical protein DMG16_30805 [Acidobacteria bacterium]|nr:MAG: hypothetical protein DMG16_30805 [Acidobacteriota bacterium]
MRATRVIIVIDDEPSDLNMMGDTLVQAGYTGVSAPDPNAALAFYQRHQGKLHLITDVAMSPINGCKLAEKLTELSQTLSVIFVSCYAGAHALRYNRRSLTHTAFLTKPFGVKHHGNQREAPSARSSFEMLFDNGHCGRNDCNFLARPEPGSKPASGGPDRPGSASARPAGKELERSRRIRPL